MSPVEREHMKNIDAKILCATKEELEAMQKIDLENQMRGITIYDALVNFTSETRSITQEQSFRNKTTK